MSATTCGHSANKMTASTTETPINSVMVLPMAVSARSKRREPTAWPTMTVVPMARPTSVTVMI